jgi:hypothetical protein
MSDLERQPGKQLAIVRYSTDHDAMDEWVYNAANIDGAKVVWARDMSPAENKSLIDYFRDRTVWLIEPDAIPPKVGRYSATSEVKPITQIRQAAANAHDSPPSTD